MKEQLYTGYAGVFDAGISLQMLINRLVSSSGDTALRNKISVVNEVPVDFRIFADLSRVTTVINELLTTVVANGKNSRIHISADRYRDIMILQIQDRNNNNGYALAFTIMSFESQAAEAGGCISIDGKEKKITTISFSFPYAQTA